MLMATLRPLRAEPELRDRARTRSATRLRLAVVVSVSLHAAIVVSLLLSFRHGGHLTETPDQKGAVELVMVQNKGAGPTTAPTQPTPESAPPEPQTPPRQAEAEPLPLPPPAPPSPSEPSAVPRQASVQPLPHAEEGLQINIGGTDSDTNAVAIGPQFIPASVDTKYRNRDPVYPEDAVRRAEQGAVVLLIHVSPQGLVSSVDVEQSSGFARLDQSARDAVSTWHFLPAVRDGQPVTFDMPLRVVFHLD